MQISVLIPSNHSQDTLQACLDSINKAVAQTPDVDVEVIILAHNQHYHNLDIAVPHTIEEIDDPQVNLTIGELRNMLIDRATKEYILFVDSDDAVYLNAFNEFAKYAGHAVIQGISNVMNTPFKALDYYFCTNICIKRELVQGIFPRISVFEDTVFEQQFHGHPDLVSVDDYTYHYTEHTGQDGTKDGTLYITNEEFWTKLKNYCQWVLRTPNIQVESDRGRLTSFWYLLTDWESQKGQKLQELFDTYSTNRQLRKQACKGLTNAVLASPVMAAPIYNDAVINGGEYQHNLVHVKANQIVRKPYQYLNPAFFIDKHCNLNCSYCKQKTFDIKARTEEQIFRDFQRAYFFMRNQCDCMMPSILGGEPTLWSDELANAIINTVVDPHYWVFTNGYNTRSPFYKDPRAIICRHIAEWEKKPVIRRETSRERFSLIVEHNKVQEIIDYINNDFPDEYKDVLFIMPCRTTDKAIAGTLADIKHIQQATGIKNYEDYVFDVDVVHYQKICFRKMLSPQIYCDTFSYVPCCAPEFYDPIPLDDFGENEARFTRNCHDCVDFISRWNIYDNRGE